MAKNNTVRDIKIKCLLCDAQIPPEHRLNHSKLHDLNMVDVCIYNIYGISKNELQVTVSPDGLCPICINIGKPKLLYDAVMKDGYYLKLFRCLKCNTLFLSNMFASNKKSKLTSLIEEDIYSHNCEDCYFSKVIEGILTCTCRKEFDTDIQIVNGNKIALYCSSYTKGNKIKRKVNGVNIK